MGAIAAAGFSRVSLIAEMPTQNHVAPKIAQQKQEKPAAPKVSAVGNSIAQRPKLVIEKASSAATSNRTRPPL